MERNAFAATSCPQKIGWKMNIAANIHAQSLVVNFAAAQMPSPFIPRGSKVLKKFSQIIISQNSEKRRKIGLAKINGENETKNRRPLKILFLLQLNGRNSQHIRRLIRLIYRPHHLYLVHVDQRQEHLFEGLPLNFCNYFK